MQDYILPVKLSLARVKSWACMYLMIWLDPSKATSFLFFLEILNVVQNIVVDAVIGTA
jgi:hypothetical protein